MGGGLVYPLSLGWYMEVRWVLYRVWYRGGITMSEGEELKRIRVEMRTLWERDRLLWYCTLPYVWERIKGMGMKG